MNFACLYAPDFSVQAAARVEEELRQQPVAILDGTPPWVKVFALNSKARQISLCLGMTKAQARLFDVKLRSRIPSQEAAAHQALLDCAYAFSPRVENTCLDTVILDIAGLERLYKTSQNIGQSLKRLATEFGLELNVGIAANPEAAALAARGFPGVTVIPVGSELKHFGPLQVSILHFSPELQETFYSWGIHTLQALAALPEIGLIERLGQEGKRLQVLARGLNQRPLVPMEPEFKFEESLELEACIELLEPLTFLLARLLQPLCARLAARSLAASAVTLTLELEPEIPEILLNQETVSTKPSEEPKHRSTLQLPVPMCDSKTLLKLFQLDLEAHPPGSPIKKVWLAAEAARPRTVQRELFVPPEPEPERMEITLARIRALVGDGRVGSPVLCNTHRPDAFQLKKFTVATVKAGSSRGQQHKRSLSKTSAVGDKGRDALPGVSQWTRGTEGAEHRVPNLPNLQPASALRRFRPSIPVRVEVRDAMPVYVTFLKQRRKVLAQAGPWRSSGDWWTETLWMHDAWDIEVMQKIHSRKAGRFELVLNPETVVYRIYQDLQTRQWFVEGVYD